MSEWSVSSRSRYDLKHINEEFERDIEELRHRTTEQIGRFEDLKRWIHEKLMSLSEGRELTLRR